MKKKWKGKTGVCHVLAQPTGARHGRRGTIWKEAQSSGDGTDVKTGENLDDVKVVEDSDF